MTVRRTSRCQPRETHEQTEGLTLEEFLLQLSLCDFNLHRLINLLRMSALVVRVVLDGGREECIDECCLP